MGESEHKETKMHYMCPVCGYNGLPRPAYYPDEWGSPSWDICPGCGTQFGYDATVIKDRTARYEFLRQRWIAEGMPWHAHKRGEPPPPAWEPAAQLAMLEARADEPGDWDVATDEES